MSDFKALSFDIDGTLVLQDYPAKIRRLCCIAQDRVQITIDPVTLRAALASANSWYDNEASRFQVIRETLWLKYSSEVLRGLEIASDELTLAFANFFCQYNSDPRNFYVPAAAKCLLTRILNSGSRLFALSGNVNALERLRLVGLERSFQRILSPRSGAVKGDLFKELVEFEALDPTELLHIGDDPVSDRAIPESLGVRGFLVVPPEVRASVHAIELSELVACVEAGYRRLAECLRISLDRT